jgi:hypothetical protein
VRSAAMMSSKPEMSREGGMGYTGPDVDQACMPQDARPSQRNGPNK